VTTLRKWASPAEPYIPHREQEGYDLHPNAIAAAQRIGAQLVLTATAVSARTTPSTRSTQRGWKSSSPTTTSPATACPTRWQS
jgi:hypothetical protein